jgi:hypothetical protein
MQALKRVSRPFIDDIYHGTDRAVSAKHTRKSMRVTSYRHIRLPDVFRLAGKTSLSTELKAGANLRTVSAC